MARPESGQCLLDCHEDTGGGGDMEGEERMDTLGWWENGNIIRTFALHFEWKFYCTFSLHF